MLDWQTSPMLLQLGTMTQLPSFRIIAPWANVWYSQRMFCAVAQSGPQTLGSAAPNDWQASPAASQGGGGGECTKPGGFGGGEGGGGGEGEGGGGVGKGGGEGEGGGGEGSGGRGGGRGGRGGLGGGSGYWHRPSFPIIMSPSV